MAGPIIFNGPDAKQINAGRIKNKNGRYYDLDVDVNYINANPDFATDTTGWTDSSGGVTVVRTTTASELPREQTRPYAGKIVAATAIADDYVAFAFSTDDADTADGPKKLALEWDQKVLGTYAAGDFEVLVYDVTNATEIIPTTTAIPAASGTFRTSWDATTSTSYELRIKTTVTDSDGITITNVYVGPGSVVTGTPLGRSESIALTTSLTGSHTVTATVQRAANMAHIRGRIDITGDNSDAALYVYLPENLRIDTNDPLFGSAAVVTGRASYQDAGGIPRYSGGIAIRGADHVQLFYSNTATAANYITEVSARANASGHPIQSSPWVSGDKVYFAFSVPIAEWSGSGTVNLGANDVEYVAHDGTNIVYGPQGAEIPSNTPGGTSESFNLTSGFSNIQPTDRFVLEIQVAGSGPWTPVDGVNVDHLYNDGTNYIGAAVRNISGAVQLTKGKYRAASTGSWAVITAGTRWRVVKHRAGIPVGFGLATSEQAGLISAEKTSGEGDLGSLSWDNTAPSGTVSKKYRWSRLGKRVNFQARIEASVAGDSNSRVFFDLPADCPTPAEFSTTGSSELEISGPGALLTHFGTATSGSASWLYKPSSGGWQVFVKHGASISSVGAVISLDYYTE